MLHDIHALLAAVFDIGLLEDWGWRLLDGVRITAEVVGISCGLGFVLAWPIAAARMSRNVFLSKAALCYVMVFRGTPLLCQLYLVYYGGGEIRPLLTQLGLWEFFRHAFWCCIFACTLNTGAYQAEIIRGAIQSVAKGQFEAGRALGLSRWHITRHIVFPQALLVALRPLTNELIGMIKASALAAIVTVLDLMGQTRYVFARTFDFSIYLYAAVLYLAATQMVARLCNRLEAALSRHLIAARAPQVAEASAGRDARRVGAAVAIEAR